MLLKNDNQKVRIAKPSLFSKKKGWAGFTQHLTSKNKLGAGFTIIELMVTIAIFTIITTVVIWENSKFNSSVLLTNLSYQIALTLRQAQVYGLSSKQFAGKTNIGYGIYFDVSDPDLAKQFVLFADTDITGGNVNTYQSSTETISTTLIGQNNRISYLCFKKGAGEPCAAVGENSVNERSATIVFKRPNSEPSLKDKSSASISQIKIIISPINDNTIKRCVIVNSAGQISVKGQTGC